MDINIIPQFDDYGNMTVLLHQGEKLVNIYVAGHSPDGTYVLNVGEHVVEPARTDLYHKSCDDLDELAHTLNVTLRAHMEGLIENGKVLIDDLNPSCVLVHVD